MFINAESGAAHYKALKPV